MTANDNNDEEEDISGHRSAVIKPKNRPSLAKSAIIKNSAIRRAPAGIGLPQRNRDEEDDDDDKPSYSSDYLQELKSLTPSTPKNLHLLRVGNGEQPVELDTILNGEEAPQGEVDLASKLGTDLTLHQQPITPIGSGLIPTATEIAEKKARRHRLAKEQEYISLTNPSDTDEGNRFPISGSNSSSDQSSDDDNNALSNNNNYRSTQRRRRRHDARKATERLVREDILNDEDDENAEGYQGRITLSRKSKREAASNRKAEIAAQIRSAEHRRHSSDSSNLSPTTSADHDEDGSRDEDEYSETERTLAYEAAQTRHGTTLLPSSSSHPNTNAPDNDNDYELYERTRPRTPPKITPLPTLQGILKKLEEKLQLARKARDESVRKAEDVGREIEDIKRREGEVQEGLKEAGERYERLKAEMEGKGKEGKEGKKDEGDLEEEVMKVQQEEEEEEEGGGKERGLENLGLRLGLGLGYRERGTEEEGVFGDGSSER